MARINQIFHMCFYAIGTKLQASRLHVAGYFRFPLNVTLTELERTLRELDREIRLQPAPLRKPRLPFIASRIGRQACATATASEEISEDCN